MINEQYIPLDNYFWSSYTPFIKTIEWKLKNKMGKSNIAYAKVPLINPKIQNIDRMNEEFVFFMDSIIQLSDQIAFLEILMEQFPKKRMIVVGENSSDLEKIKESIKSDQFDFITLNGTDEIPDEKYDYLVLLSDVYFREIEAVRPELFKHFRSNYDAFSIKTRMEVEYQDYERKLYRYYLDPDRIKTKDAYLSHFLEKNLLLKKNDYFTLSDVDKIISGVRNGQLDLELLEEISADMGFPVWEPEFGCNPENPYDSNIELEFILNNTNKYFPLYDPDHLLGSAKVFKLMDLILDDYRHLRIEDFLELEQFDERILFFQILIDYMYFSKIISSEYDFEEGRTDTENIEIMSEKVENFYSFLQTSPENIENQDIPITNNRYQSAFYIEKENFINKYQNFLNYLDSLRDQTKTKLFLNDDVSLFNRIKDLDGGSRRYGSLWIDILKHILKNQEVTKQFSEVDDESTFSSLVSPIILECISSDIRHYTELIKWPADIKKFITILYECRMEFENGLK